MQKMLLTRRGRFGCCLYGDPVMPPLVLLMGLGMNAASWPEPFLTRLVRKGLYVIAPDNRDSGSSMLGTESVSKTRMFASIAKYIAGGSVHAEYRLEDMAADTESILDELGVERAHIAVSCAASHGESDEYFLGNGQRHYRRGKSCCHSLGTATGADYEGSTGVAQLFAQRDDVHWHEKRDLQR